MHSVIAVKPSISFTVRKSHLVLTGLIFLGLLFGLSTAPALANDDNRGRETGLPLPRFVSLKAKSVNLRVGPGRAYAITWQYKKRGLPVEVIQEFEQWRRVRDSEGATGWVLHSLLSSKRTAIVAPWEKPQFESGKVKKAAFFNGKNSASKESSTIAKLQPGLMVAVQECGQNWCEVEAQSTRFWLSQDNMWGVYPGESIED